MAEFIASLLLLFQIEMGHAAYYSEGRMEQTVVIRQAGWTAYPLPRELPPVHDFIATDDCGEVGRQVWLFRPGQGFSRALIADCCNELAGDCDRMRGRGIIAEIGHNTAVRWGALGLGPEDIDIAIIRSRQ